VNVSCMSWVAGCTLLAVAATEGHAIQLWTVPPLWPEQYRTGVPVASPDLQFQGSSSLQAPQMVATLRGHTDQVLSMTPLSLPPSSSPQPSGSRGIPSSQATAQDQQGGMVENPFGLGQGEHLAVVSTAWLLTASRDQSVRSWAVQPARVLSQYHQQQALQRQKEEQERREREEEAERERLRQEAAQALEAAKARVQAMAAEMMAKAQAAPPAGPQAEVAADGQPSSASQHDLPAAVPPPPRPPQETAGRAVHETDEKAGQQGQQGVPLSFPLVAALPAKSEITGVQPQGRPAGSTGAPPSQGTAGGGSSGGQQSAPTYKRGIAYMGSHSIMPSVTGHTLTQGAAVTHPEVLAVAREALAALASSAFHPSPAVSHLLAALESVTRAAESDSVVAQQESVTGEQGLPPEAGVAGEGETLGPSNSATAAAASLRATATSSAPSPGAQALPPSALAAAGDPARLAALLSGDLGAMTASGALGPLTPERAIVAHMWRGDVRSALQVRFTISKG
jgi:hypothetical protein